MALRPYNGEMPRIAEGAFVDETALVIGDVHIGPECSVWPMAVARGDVNRIRVGRGTNIQDGSVLHATHDGPYNPGGVPLEIGDYVTIGHNVVLHACQVGNLCLIGMGAVVLDRAVLEGQLIIGAGSLVPPGRVLKSGYLYLGSPAQQKRDLTPGEIKFLEYSAQNYIKLKNQYVGQDVGQVDITRR